MMEFEGWLKDAKPLRIPEGFYKKTATLILPIVPDESRRPLRDADPNSGANPIATDPEVLHPGDIIPGTTTIRAGSRRIGG